MSGFETLVCVWVMISSSLFVCGSNIIGTVNQSNQRRGRAHHFLSSLLSRMAELGIGCVSGASGAPCVRRTVSPAFHCQGCLATPSTGRLCNVHWRRGAVVVVCWLLVSVACVTFWLVAKTTR